MAMNSQDRSTDAFNSAATFTEVQTRQAAIDAAFARTSSAVMSGHA